MKKVDSPGWFWSTSGEGNTFNGPHESKEACIVDAQAETGEQDGFFISTSHTVEVSLDADQVLEWWACDGSDCLYEDALDSWCVVVSKESRAALSDELTKVFKKHLKEWGEDYSWDVISDAAKYVAETNVS